MSKLSSTWSSTRLMLIIVILYLCTTSVRSEWKSTQKLVDKIVRKMTSGIKRLEKLHPKLLSNHGVAKAIDKCKDLFRSSSKELKTTLDAFQDPYEYNGHLKRELRLWLNGVIDNQEICLIGFGKDRVAQRFVRKALEGLVQDLIGLIDGSKPKKGWKKDEDVQDDREGEDYDDDEYDNDDDRDDKDWDDDGYDDKEIKQKKNHNKNKKWGVVVSRLRLMASLAIATSKKGGQEPTPPVAQENLKADAIVAKDGTGNYSRIMDAVNSAPIESTRPFVIYIKKGIYNEKVEISPTKVNLVMIGDGMNATIISGNLNFASGIALPKTATFGVLADRFVAKDLTMENTAGPDKHQAVALLASGDQVAFHRCSFRGYQNTLYLTSKRQFFKECTITGTHDIITGSSTAMFQSCTVLVRKGLQGQSNFITAHGAGSKKNKHSGFSFQFCKILPEDTVAESTETYLGRPSNAFSRVVVMQSFMSSIISPEGWTEWMGTVYLDTLYYAEYDNEGLGADTSKRVKWRNYHPNILRSEARKFTVAHFIKGNTWLPSMGVPYIPVGL